MTLVIVTGPPATGKTHIANAIEKETGWPVISKDRIKERLFNERGIGDRAWSSKLGDEAYEIVRQQAKTMFESRQPFILEGNFSGPTAEFILAHTQNFEYRILQILCDAPDHLILARIQERWSSGERHRGHADHQTLQEYAKGHDWNSIRQFSFSDRNIRLDEKSSLEKNTTAALRFVKLNKT